MIMDNITVPLKSPVDFNGEFSELTFREPDVGDMIAAEAAAREFGGGQQAMTAALLSSVAGVSFGAFQRVKARDLKTILEATKAYLGN
jgi:hypothetical protein